MFIYRAHKHHRCRGMLWQIQLLCLLTWLTLILLTWRIWWACNNASKWQMVFNWAFKGLENVPIHATVKKLLKWELYLSEVYTLYYILLIGVVGHFQKIWLSSVWSSCMYCQMQSKIKWTSESLVQLKVIMSLVFVEQFQRATIQIDTFCLPNIP